jgi:hypothetical protein
MIWVAVALGVVVFYLVFRYLTPLVVGGFLGANTPITSGKGKASGSAPARPSVVASGPSLQTVPAASSSRPSAPSPNLRLSDAMPAVMQGVYWTRLVQVEGRIYVYLSDGRVLTSPSRALYDAGGVVDVIDLEGRLWRVSRQMQWGASASGDGRGSVSGTHAVPNVHNIPKAFK